jgi:hypothetical protein
MRRRRNRSFQFLNVHTDPLLPTHTPGPGRQLLDIHAHHLLLRGRRAAPRRTRSTLFGVAFEEFLNFPLVYVCADEAQDFDGDERGCDVGNEEADAGPKGWVDEEGAHVFEC